MAATPHEAADRVRQARALPASSQQCKLISKFGNLRVDMDGLTPPPDPLIGSNDREFEGTFDPIYIRLRDRADEEGDVRRKFVEGLWQRFHLDADSNFRTEFKSRCQERFWEMYLTVSFRKWAEESGHSMRCPKPGPDIRLEIDGKVVWIEAVAASPGMPGCPNEVKGPQPGKVYTAPQDLIQLRLLNALDTKLKVRLGYKEKAKKIVQDDEAYIVAVNTGSLPTNYRCLSHFPYALTAVLPVGKSHLIFDSETKSLLEHRASHRPTIAKIGKDGKVQLPGDSFLSDKFRPISAILHSDAEFANFANTPMGCDFVLVHNPNANSPVPSSVLPCVQEWMTTVSEEQLEIRMESGTLTK